MTSRTDGFTPSQAPHIDVLQPAAVRYWTRELRCSEHELRAAVNAVGCCEKTVRNWLQGRALERARAEVMTAPRIGTLSGPRDDPSNATEPMT